MDKGEMKTWGRAGVLVDTIVDFCMPQSRMMGILDTLVWNIVYIQVYIYVYIMCWVAITGRLGELIFSLLFSVYCESSCIEEFLLVVTYLPRL